MRNHSVPPSLFGPLGAEADPLGAPVPADDLPAAGTFTHPDEVVSDARLPVARKRAILASWASDRRSVRDAPSLRQLDSGAIVGIDEILAALSALDGRGFGAPSAVGLGVERRLVRGRLSARAIDRDDDPPPCGAAAARPFRPICVKALARSAA